jgi:putative ABC transport system permease protein
MPARFPGSEWSSPLASLALGARVRSLSPEIAGEARTAASAAVFCVWAWFPRTRFFPTVRFNGGCDGLVRPDALLIDTKTRSDFGPRDGRRFGPLDYGVDVELNDAKVRIVGDYTLGAGLSAGGALIMSQRGLQQVMPALADDRVSLGLIKIAPGENAKEVAIRLGKQLSDDVDVLTRQEVLDGELAHWVYETNYGLIFQTGVLVSLIVGTAIVYQVLASDVASLLPEYATLKAMGYSNRYLARVILQQALALAVLGFASGVVIAELLYAVTSAGAQIPVQMTAQNLVLVFVLTVVMCTCSGLAALRKAFQADPADLF